MTAPSKFAHVVYNTHRYDEMIEWYQLVFEARVQHRDEKLAFLTYDDEHHRFAFANLGPVADGEPPKRPSGVGVNHVAYTWATLDGLLETYTRLKVAGIVPKLPIRHGPTLSMYYADPDGNMMEFQVDLLDSEATNGFIRGDAFAANPFGERFDPDEFVARHAAGDPVDDLVLRSDQTPVPAELGAALRPT